MKIIVENFIEKDTKKHLTEVEKRGWLVGHKGCIFLWNKRASLSKIEDAFILCQVDQDKFSLVSIISGNRYWDEKKTTEIYRDIKDLFRQVGFLSTVTINYNED